MEEEEFLDDFLEVFLEQSGHISGRIHVEYIEKRLFDI